MADWGLANGPNDTRSHAEMMMEVVIKRNRNPNKPCSECGGEFGRIAEDEEEPPEALRTYECSSCGERTYKWKQKSKSQTSDEYTWD